MSADVVGKKMLMFIGFMFKVRGSEKVEPLLEQALRKVDRVAVGLQRVERHQLQVGLAAQVHLQHLLVLRQLRLLGAEEGAGVDGGRLRAGVLADDVLDEGGEDHGDELGARLQRRRHIVLQPAVERGRGALRRGDLPGDVRLDAQHRIEKGEIAVLENVRHALLVAVVLRQHADQADLRLGEGLKEPRLALRLVQVLQQQRKERVVLAALQQANRPLDDQLGDKAGDQRAGTGRLHLQLDHLAEEVLQGGQEGGVGDSLRRARGATFLATCCRFSSFTWACLHLDDQLVGQIALRLCLANGDANDDEQRLVKGNVNRLQAVDKVLRVFALEVLRQQLLHLDDDIDGLAGLRRRRVAAVTISRHLQLAHLIHKAVHVLAVHVLAHHRIATAKLAAAVTASPAAVTNAAGKCIAGKIGGHRLRTKQAHLVALVNAQRWLVHLQASRTVGATQSIGHWLQLILHKWLKGGHRATAAHSSSSALLHLLLLKAGRQVDHVAIGIQLVQSIRQHVHRIRRLLAVVAAVWETARATAKARTATIAVAVTVAAIHSTNLAFNTLAVTSSTTTVIAVTTAAHSRASAADSAAATASVTSVARHSAAVSLALTLQVLYLVRQALGLLLGEQLLDAVVEDVLREQLLLAKLADKANVAEHLLLGNGSLLLIVGAEWFGPEFILLKCISPVFKLVPALGQQY
ncbi:hypothetical protein TYRP_002243 [Tyrophagus putrescentiae]|nr:hypothetical protein TYRP_002243 [Tyrophagus putrescentiae]